MEVQAWYLVLIWPIFYFVHLFFYKRKWYNLNFRGEKSTYSLGISLYFSVALASTLAVISGMSLSALVYLTVVTLLGLFDDLYGSDVAKGVKGHVLYCLDHGTVTTGIVKLVGLPIAAFVYLFSRFEGQLNVAVLLALLNFTLFPHVVNLFDTRPLRSFKLFMIFLFIVICFYIPDFSWFFVFVITLVIWAGLEMYERAMLGDNGAALIGGGMGLLSLLVPFSVQIVFLLIAFLLTVAAERMSFHKIIEKRPFLQRIDQIGRRRVFQKH
ncbi:hypothetical protein [Texcoconibacillus texcoconensis]|uniref:UDP-N-acetylmuramyl pentapeptide phosphotransferase n=1 Tax=Texcoconibacillus texcoconensis TaxID=1095777 RepID=A0A840QNU1_9BACI|nr:hypothetical protein [Texcoconibacillus texcoconensis]MBB5173052.1 hypothetical protein [Texcoconibacillus texcoconensis]